MIFYRIENGTNKSEIGKRKEVYPPFRRNPESFGSAAPVRRIPDSCGEETSDKGDHG
jgi:hypothetical protein